MPTSVTAKTTLRPRGPAAAAVLAMVLLLGRGATAEAARKKVALFAFAGPDGATIEEGVSRALGEDHDVVPSNEFARALRAAEPQPGQAEEAIGRAARSLGAHAVVAGRVKMVKERWEVELQVRNGADGTVIESLTFDLKDPEIDEKVAKRIRTDMADALGRAMRGAPLKLLPRGEPKDKEEEAAPPRRGREAAEEEPPTRAAGGKTGGKAAAKDEEEPPRKGAGGKAAKDEEEPPRKGAGKGAEKDKADEESPPPKPRREEVEEEPKPPAGPGVLELAWQAAKISVPRAEAFLGLSVVSRSFAYDIADLQQYASGASPGFVGGGEAFPLQQFGLGHLGNFGVGFGFGTEPFNKAVLNDASSPITQWHFYVDLRWAYRLSDHVMLIPELGFGQHVFRLSDKKFVPPSQCTTMSTDLCLANVNLTYLRAGGEARLAIAPSVTGHARLSLLPVLAIGTAPGQIASENNAAAFGLGGELGLTVTVWRMIGVRAAFEFTNFWIGLTPDEGVMPVYGGATDSYVGGKLMAVGKY